MLKRRHQLFITLFVVADAGVIAAAAFTAWVGRLRAFDQPLPSDWESYLKDSLVLVTVPLALTVLQTLRLYAPQRDRSLVIEQLEVLKATTVATACVVLLLWILGNDLIDATPPEAGTGLVNGIGVARFQIGALAIALPLFVGLQRLAIRLTLRELRKRGLNRRHVAIIGTGRLAQRVARTIARNSWTGLKVSYFVSHHAETRRPQCLDRPVVGGLADIEDILTNYPIDAVYLALPAAQAGAVPDLLHRLERYTVNVRYVPDVNHRHIPQQMCINQLEGMPILSYREDPTLGIGGLTKRSIDIIGAILGLALLSPLLLTIAVAIKLTSPGRVLFKQSRVSIGSDEFKIYKFRTMTAARSENEPRWTERNDPRVTPLGRFLRKTSLDELPQLFNVLRGEMSLVGPRPERPELVAKFRDDEPGYLLRQQVKAGMTGWAQIHGLRGDTGLRKRLRYDLFYIRNWSLALDVRILFATILRGFVHRNAH